MSSMDMKYFVTDLRGAISRLDKMRGILLVCILFPLIINLPADAQKEALIQNGTQAGITATVMTRYIYFYVTAIIIAYTVPFRCYGRITERKTGSNFLMLPAAPLVKTASMAVISTILIPLAFVTLYLITDWILCTLIGPEKTGDSLFSMIMAPFPAIAKTFFDTDTWTLRSGLFIALFYCRIMLASMFFLLSSVLCRKGKMVTGLAFLTAHAMLQLLILDKADEIFGDWNFDNIFALLCLVKNIAVYLLLCIPVYYRIRRLQN